MSITITPNTQYEIPLSSANQILSITLNGVIYFIRFLYNQTLDENASWLIDFYDSNQNAIVQGIPLVTGEDLLVQYKYLNIKVALYCFTDGNPYAIPTFQNLGTTAHVYYENL